MSAAAWASGNTGSCTLVEANTSGRVNTASMSSIRMTTTWPISSAKNTGWSPCNRVAIG